MKEKTLVEKYIPIIDRFTMEKLKLSEGFVAPERRCHARNLQECIDTSLQNGNDFACASCSEYY